MALSWVVRSILTAYPPLGRLLLRAYGRTVFRVPARARWLWGALQAELTPPGSIRTVRLGSGLRMRVDAGTVQGGVIYYRGCGDPALARFLRQTLRPGMTVVDGGANIGEFTLRSARLVGPRGKVYALEPSSETFPDLEFNVALNRLENVRPLRLAVSDTDGPVSFYSRGRASGAASLFAATAAGEAETVPGTMLDTLAETEKLDGIDLIKLDVEGAEFAACRGMSRLLSGPRPPVVVFEYHAEVARSNGWGLADVCAFFRSRGYRVRHLNNDEPVGDGEPPTRGDGNPGFVARRE